MDDNAVLVGTNSGQSQQPAKMPYKTTFGGQLLALVKRNIIIKKRSKWRTIMEIVLPLYFVVILFSMKYSMKPKEFQEISKPYGQGMTTDANILSMMQSWAVAPDTPHTRQITNATVYILKSWSRILEFNISYLNSSNEIEMMYKRDSNSVKVGIIFEDNSSPALTKVVNYTIRMPYSQVPKHTQLFGDLGTCREDNPFVQFGFNCQGISYYHSGYTVIQNAIDTALIQLNTQSGKKPNIPSASLQVYPKYKFTSSNTMWLALLPTYLAFGFIPLVSILTAMFVVEKEKKIKEGMFMMGLRMSSYWMGWFVVESVLVLILSVIVTVAVFAAEIIQNVNPAIFFILIFLYGQSLVMLAALISPFFKKEKVAGTVASLFTTFAGLLHMLIVFMVGKVPSWVINLFAILSPTAFSLGVQDMTRFGIEGNTQLSFSELFHDSVFPVGSAMLMLIFDNILYAVLAMYFDQVIPGEYGPRQSFLFFLKKSYWSPQVREISRTETLEEGSDTEEMSQELRSKAAIQIRKITKVFKEKKKNTTAVDKLSLAIYEDQITGILGHNGAGKSTLINMLVGTIPPTSGSASIYGFNIENPADMQHLRGMFGVCLQQDILFDDLNAFEHLQFFAAMKGIPSNQHNSETETWLRNLGLYDNRETASKDLSGGQKRKLCIAIALIGEPKVVLLDEPTSGVDAYSRRQVWSLLQNFRKGRVIILTTHFMDEADVLADRKAIISKGKLRCVGSSLFLKNRFGIGYHLTIELKDNSHKQMIETLVKSKIQNAELEREAGKELFFILPRGDTELFPDLFRTLEESTASNGGSIKNYGISMTTLEEVFLKLGEEDNDEQSKQSNGRDASVTTANFESLPIGQLKTNPTFFKSFYAFLWLRFRIIFRTPAHIFTILFFPSLMILLSYFLMKSTIVDSPNPQPLLLKPQIYPNDTNVLRYLKKGDINNFAELVEQTGTKPMNISEFDLEQLGNSYMSIQVDSFDSITSKWSWIFNETYLHALPIMQNLLSNVYWKSVKGNGDVMEQIDVFNHPFPQNSQDSPVTFDPKVITYVIFISIIMAYIPSLLCVDVVEDRETKVKDLLRVCGLSFNAYWLSTLVSHFVLFFIPTVLMLIICNYILQLDFLYKYSGAFGSAVIIFILYIPASLLACYVISHLFNKKDIARSIMPTLCYVPGMVMVIFVLIYSQISSVGGTLHYIFCFTFPFYIPAGGLFYIAMVYIKVEVLESLKEPIGAHLFYTDDKIYICFIAASFHIVLFALLLPCVEVVKNGGNLLEFLGFKVASLVNTSEPSSLEDEDVRKERSDVEHHLNDRIQARFPILLLNQLRKVYFKRNFKDRMKCKPPTGTPAVHNLSLAVEPGQIFGLLGPNGAGKTTAIRMMIADERPTAGQVFIVNQEVTSALSKVLQMIGYCPQHDALFKDITLKEHLYAFANIRGIPANVVGSVCDKLMTDIQIIEHADKKVEHLSGGTKRKLCYCIALLGEPKLVLLDEPSTGMDPQAKRYLWQHIQSVFAKNSEKAAVLTTHSMEEADALCTKLAIMVKSVMRCVGSIQHLKNKYGAGYVLEIKWDQSEGDVSSQSVKHQVAGIFPHHVIKEEYHNRLIFAIPQNEVKSIAVTFSTLEQWKRNMRGIKEYSFSQTTIEQVFLEFAREQEEGELNEIEIR